MLNSRFHFRAILVLTRLYPPTANRAPTMNLLFCLTVAATAASAYALTYSSPVVAVYSRRPGFFGKENVLICHVSDFHPPNLSIQLLEDGREMTNANQTDLAFKPNWRFHLTKSVTFTPCAGHQYSCRVTHASKPPKTYNWDPEV